MKRSFDEWASDPNYMHLIPLELHKSLAAKVLMNICITERVDPNRCRVPDHVVMNPNWVPEKELLLRLSVILLLPGAYHDRTWLKQTVFEILEHLK